MFLKKIELRGFKSFAEKTTIDFPSQHNGHVITGIVGPNGSGKSNIADAIRWVLGEQSIKMLRGKKSRDVIFAGTDQKARLSSAEVLLHLDNSSNTAPVDMAEILIGRRLYRSGESEYLINNKRALLQNINLLLARAHFGHRTYSIIGQGMVDSFVTAGASERQELLEEAAGVKEFQLKKQESINKLAASSRNLEQVSALLSEIHPRLRSLTRQVKRLERKETLANSLKDLQITYYGNKWHAWQQELDSLEKELSKLTSSWKEYKKETDELQTIWQKVALSESVSSSFQKLQRDYENILNKRNQLFQEEFKIKNAMLSAKNDKTQKENPLLKPQFLNRLTEHLNQIKFVIKKVLTMHSENDLNALKSDLLSLLEKNSSLEKELKKDEENTSNNDPGLAAKLEKIKDEEEHLTKQLEENQQKINKLKQEEQSKNQKIIDIQQKLQKEQSRLNDTSGKLNEQKIKKARLDAKMEDLAGEIKDEQLHLEEIKKYKPRKITDEEGLKNEIGKLKHQLELIGGIDEETVDEYKTTKERFEFLSKEVEDSKNAIKSLEKIIVELDKKIESQFNTAFLNINKLFAKYFYILFGGGKAHLKKLSPPKETKTAESKEDITEEVATEENDETLLAKTWSNYSKNKLSAGIEIQATPPGKKLTSITMLSGGEKALTAIALICSIIANRPSPFVVLDEVDAALDEANSERFAKILEELSHQTQFIVITHNRATMHRAKILYGVSMGKDGVSQMLSVDLENVDKKIK